MIAYQLQTNKLHKGISCNISPKSMPVQRLRTRKMLPDNHTLVLLVSFHIRVRVITYGKNVWRHFAYFLVSVLLYLFSCVDWQNLIWIHCY